MRIRDTGVKVGNLPCGALNKITDVPGVRVGHATIHDDTHHTGVTVIEFKEEFGYAQPRISMLSSDAHLYKEGLTTNYKNFFII